MSLKFNVKNTFINNGLKISNVNNEFKYLKSKFGKISHIISKILNNLHINKEQTINIPLKYDFNDLINTVKIISKNKKDSRLIEFNVALDNNKLTKNEIINTCDLLCSEIYDNISIILFSDKFLNDLYKVYNTNIITKFISIDIQEEIITTMNTLEIYNISYGSNTIIFKFFSNNGYDKIKSSLLILKTFIILEIHNKVINNFTLNFFPTKIKKELIDNSVIFGPKSINSGFTTIYYNDKTEITLFRDEEIEKVLIHEMIHACKLDKYIWENEKSIDHKFKCHFNIPKNMKINLGEAYTECMAVIYHCLINSSLHNLNFVELLNTEYNFNLQQCKIILHHFGYDDISTFFNLKSCLLYDSKWKEKTSVFSYFILKTVLLFDPEYFISTIVNETYINLEYLFIYLTETFEKNTQYINKLKNINSKSLRMTSIDYNLYL